MLSKGAGFANFSRGLCWVVSLIWLALAVLYFTGGGDNSTVVGFGWLAGAIAFAGSALFMGRNSGPSESADNSKPQV